MKQQNKPKWLNGFWQAGLLFGCLFVAALVVAACSSSTTGGSSSGTAVVNVHLSDPATCQAPAGPYSHVYVTISDVQANVSATAAAIDSGWVDLTPNLSKAPMQIDLLGQANNQCFLATLGDNQQLQAGSYQQIRLILAANSATVTNNACGSSANCVVLVSDSSVHALQLSSEAQTGIKIPSGQIASGSFTIAAGQTKDLDIDFSTCESIVQEGGQYRLKPVLHAGEVSTTSTSINGKVLDQLTGNPVSGTVLVAVEQKDSSGVDRVQRSTLTASDGSFVFCPLAAGTYDVVIVGTRADGSLYQPSIVTGVAVGSTVGSVNLYLPTIVTSSSLTLAGTVTSQNSSNAGTVADIGLSVLESVNSTTYTIPLPPTSTQSSATLSVETAASTAHAPCASGIDCAGYSMVVPSGAAYIGAWAAAGATLTLSTSPVSYVVDGQAFVQGSGGTADCTPSELQSTAYTPTSTGPVQTLAFMQCQ
ncbi:MAG TPA: DUF4382 domain-containing protein [Terracidiphilus sp.]|jgi:hypothetical protein|nr:DUF4382 domain-containing protein [Terracidiphilus sp.]